MQLRILFLVCAMAFAAGKSFKGQFKKSEGPAACADKLSAKVEGKKLAVEEVGSKKIGASGVCAKTLTKDSNSQYGIEENPTGTVSAAKLVVDTSCPGAHERVTYNLSLGDGKAELVYDVEGGPEPLHCGYVETKK